MMGDGVWVMNFQNPRSIEITIEHGLALILRICADLFLVTEDRYCTPVQIHLLGRAC